MIKHQEHRKGEVENRDGGEKSLAGCRTMNASSSHTPQPVRRKAEDGERTSQVLRLPGKAGMSPRMERAMIT